MVAVSHAAQAAAAPRMVAAWLDGLEGVYPNEDRSVFEAALAYARGRCGDTRGRDGEPLIDRAVGTAMIVAGLKLDAGTVRAALLTALRAPARSMPTTSSARFGADAATLVAGAARMDEIRAMPPQGDAAERAAQAERLRKMLLAMVEDIRVVLLKLAERTAALRYLMTAARDARNAAAGGARGARSLRAARQPPRRVAVEVGARGLEPARARARSVQDDRRVLDERRLDRQRYIEDVIAMLARELAAAGVARRSPAGRSTSTASGSRCAASSRASTALRHPRRADPGRRRQGLLCRARQRPSPWTPLPREFDDYIAKPKANDYRRCTRR
jgi:GTP pyrophosphokinase